MMSVNIFQPHHPFFPTEEYLAHYDPAKMPNPAYKEGELDHKTPFQQIDHKRAYGGTALSFTKTSPEEHRKITAAYYAMIEQVDTEVGHMLQALDETGQADNTIVIFMSDHGEMLGDHGIYLKGPYFYDCLTRVPLIIRWPKHFKAGLRSIRWWNCLTLRPRCWSRLAFLYPRRNAGPVADAAADGCHDSASRLGLHGVLQLKLRVSDSTDVDRRPHRTLEAELLRATQSTGSCTT